MHITQGPDIISIKLKVQKHIFLYEGFPYRNLPDAQSSGTFSPEQTLEKVGGG